MRGKETLIRLVTATGMIGGAIMAGSALESHKISRVNAENNRSPLCHSGNGENWNIIKPSESSYDAHIKDWEGPAKGHDNDYFASDSNGDGDITKEDCGFYPTPTLARTEWPTKTFTPIPTDIATATKTKEYPTKTATDIVTATKTKEYPTKTATDIATATKTTEYPTPTVTDTATATKTKEYPTKTATDIATATKTAEYPTPTSTILKTETPEFTHTPTETSLCPVCPTCGTEGDNCECELAAAGTIAASVKLAGEMNSTAMIQAAGTEAASNLQAAATVAAALNENAKDTDTSSNNFDSVLLTVAAGTGIGILGGNEILKRKKKV